MTAVRRRKGDRRGYRARYKAAARRTTHLTWQEKAAADVLIDPDLCNDKGRSRANREEYADRLGITGDRWSHLVGALVRKGWASRVEGSGHRGTVAAYDVMIPAGQDAPERLAGGADSYPEKGYLNAREEPSAAPEQTERLRETANLFLPTFPSGDPAERLVRSTNLNARATTDAPLQSNDTSRQTRPTTRARRDTDVDHDERGGSEPDHSPNYSSDEEPSGLGAAATADPEVTTTGQDTTTEVPPPAGDVDCVLCHQPLPRGLAMLGRTAHTEGCPEPTHGSATAA